MIAIAAHAMTNIPLVWTGSNKACELYCQPRLAHCSAYCCLSVILGGVEVTEAPHALKVLITRMNYVNHWTLEN